MIRTVRLMPDYQCWPLWVREGDSVSDNADPSGLPISAPLVDELNRWRLAYDATLNWDDPRNSGFPSPEEKEAFVAEGERLARQLAAELGDAYVVQYFDISTAETKTVE